MKLVRWNPNRTATSVSKDFDSMINSLFKSSFDWDTDRCCFTPRVDIVENDDNVTLMAEVPGMEKGEIKVSVEDDVLTISGEKKATSKEEKENYIRAEMYRGSFSRSFTLPDYVDSEKIKADYKNGILKVNLPKTEKAKPKEISVEVN
jgi:HSP20 family protein